MSKFIEVTFITKEFTNANVVEIQEIGEEDESPANDHREETCQGMINVEDIRDFYPRRPHRDGTARIGTRIVFKNGAGQPVTNSYDEVKGLIQVH